MGLASALGNVYTERVSKPIQGEVMPETTQDLAPVQAPSVPQANRHKGGRPKGAPDKKSALRVQLAAANSIIKREARHKLVKMVVAELEPIVTAQMEKAKGLSVIMVKDEDGAWKRVTDPAVIEAAMNSGAEGAVWKIATTDPDTQAAKYLIDQTIDKATEHQEVTGEGGEPLVVRWVR